MKLPFATPYGQKFATKTGIDEYPPTRTKQEFKSECDINHIVKRFNRDGVLTHVNANPQVFTEITDIDYRNALDTLIAAQSTFDALPSNVRERFANDPAKLLNFIQNSENYEEALKLGLVNKRPEPPEPTTPTTPTTSTTPTTPTTPTPKT